MSVHDDVPVLGNLLNLRKLTESIDRAEMLEQAIRQYRDLYYRADNPLVDDERYDALKTELLEIYGDDIPDDSVLKEHQ